jgi:geranylgeranyl reductase family protein
VTTRFDVLVVGAGPAGAAAAMAALSEDPAARVGLLDRAEFPRDKVCGDGVTAGAVAVLRELDATGVLDGLTPIDVLSLTSPGGHTARVRTGEPAYVVPRRVLDARLREAARGRGAELLTEKVTEIAPAGDHVLVNGRYEAGCVIGADGANSVVRRQLGVPRQPSAHNGLAMRAYATGARGVPRLQAWFGSRTQLSYYWLFTTGDGPANIGYITFDGSLQPRRDQLVTAIREQFADLDIDPETLRAHQLPLSTCRPPADHGRVLLAGDAASLVNPLTGEGIHTALLSGALAGRATVRHASDPAPAYRAALQRRLGRHVRHTTAAARAVRHRRSLDATISTMADRPRVAARVSRVALGTGTMSPLAVAAILSRVFTDARHRR